MAVLTWDGPGQKKFETGVDRGVLYLPDETGAYTKGYAWNGLTSVSESPSGAEANKSYADNIVYMTLLSAEEMAATVEAYTYPDEFAICDGSYEAADGVFVGQQTRQPFGMAYRTKVGDDLKGTESGFKIHLIYNAFAAPSEKAYSSVNDSPEAATFSWELSTTPVSVDANRSTALITIDSTKATKAKMDAFLAILWGTASIEPKLPKPSEVIAAFAGA